jgi:hypothetical protein
MEQIIVVQWKTVEKVKKTIFKRHWLPITKYAELSHSYLILLHLHPYIPSLYFHED